MQYDNRKRRLRAARIAKIKRVTLIIILLLLVACMIAISIWGVINIGTEAIVTPTYSHSVTPTPSFPSSPSTFNPSFTIDPSMLGSEFTPICTPAPMFNDLVDPRGDTVLTRFKVPNGFERVSAEEGSFGQYLRNLALAPDGEALHFFDGKLSDNPAHAAILKRDLPKRYEQCADTIIGIYANYLYDNNLYDKLCFTFNNGFECDFKHFTQGYRPNADATKWITSSDFWTGYDKRVFDVFLDYVYLYANTASLFENELEKADPDSPKIGDVFIVPGFPGHVIMICDIIKNSSTGEIRFMTLQSSMPAVQPHIMLNALEPEMSPWQNTRYEYGGFLSATGWLCPKENIMRFRNI